MNVQRLLGRKGDLNRDYYAREVYNRKFRTFLKIISITLSVISIEWSVFMSNWIPAFVAATVILCSYLLYRRLKYKRKHPF
ncbi:hypothetical protein KW799_02040 [Candidatus Parcubacteria bacterium]|nr:hypothetical protein [Candidatus Parcubacteria bacterium]